MLSALTFFGLIQTVPELISPWNLFSSEKDSDQQENNYHNHSSSTTTTTTTTSTFQFCGIYTTPTPRPRSLPPFIDIAYFKNHAKGAVFASILGSVIGVPLKYRPQITETMIDQALSMIGGGLNRLLPGQLTLDAELAANLIDTVYNSGKRYTIEIALQSYQNWYNSEPFELTVALRSSFKPLENIRSDNYKEMQKVMTAASLKGVKSEDNSGFLRIIVVAVLNSNITDETDFISIIKDDIKLTNANPKVINASICYALTIRHLLRNKNDADGAIKAARDWSDTLDNGLEDWWDIVDEEEFIEATVNQTSLKIGWTYAYIILKKKCNDFIEICKTILEKGGDTENNLGIVMGLIGAYLGNERLDELEGQKHVLNSYNPEQALRPMHYTAKNCMNLLDNILDNMKFDKHE